MSCAYSNTMDSRENGHGGDFERRCKGHWSCSNIAAMVIGFVLFWPVGLFILAWTLSGRPVQTLPGAIKKQWRAFRSEHRGQASGGSDNVVFDEYQDTQYDRIREIKEEIKDRARRFSQFREDARRQADQAEFDEFMSTNPGKQDEHE